MLTYSRTVHSCMQISQQRNWTKAVNHSALTEAGVHARPHFGIVRLPVKDITQKNTGVCLQSHHKTAWDRLLKTIGWLED